MNEKVLVTIPHFSDSARDALKALGEVVCATPTQEELDATIGEYSVLVVGLGVTFHKETLDRAKNLRVIATATTGLDHIDVEYAGERGIVILSLKNEHEFLDTITGTAELAFGLMVDLSRMITSAHRAVVERGEWDREKYRGTSLYGKTLGIVGMGRLGKIMAWGARGFRMKVVFADPNVAQEAFPEFQKVSLPELLGQSDYIAVHVHLTKETEGMIGREAFKKMRRGVKLINTSRGKIINEKDLLEALEDGTVGGYGTDVLSSELDFAGDASNDPLVQYARNHEQVIITPHIGGMTADSRTATDVFIANKVREHFGA